MFNNEKELRIWFDSVCTDCAKRGQCYDCGRCRISELYEQKKEELKEQKEVRKVS